MAPSIPLYPIIALPVAAALYLFWRRLRLHLRTFPALGHGSHFGGDEEIARDTYASKHPRTDAFRRLRFAPVCLADRALRIKNVGARRQWRFSERSPASS